MLTTLQKDKLTGEFWRLATQNKEGCWVYSGAVTHRNTGTFSHRPVQIDQTAMSPRAKAYTLLRGKIPGYRIRMKCQNKDCINPNHMEFTHKSVKPKNIELSKYRHLVTPASDTGIKHNKRTRKARLQQILSRYDAYIQGF
jgi:hypothetical protein